MTTTTFGYCATHGSPLRAGVCKGCAAGLAEVRPERRLNVGCGSYPLLYWTNLDESKAATADVYATVPPLPYADGALDEIYAGHFLEHLTTQDAGYFLRECFRCLRSGGRLGVVVPDTREVLARWLAGTNDAFYDGATGVWYPVADLDAVCAVFIYSTIQPSPHRWCYDLRTLERRVMAAGFTVTGEINRYTDERIPMGAWYQCGLDARRP